MATTRTGEHKKTIDILKFPRTKHILDAGGNGVTRDDLLMSKKDAERFIKKKVISVEEKIDGANLGISISEDFEILAQNRSHFVTSSSHKQFATIDSWISTNREDLVKILQNGRFILFGEWMYAKHSIYYTRLPNHFIAFDIFDVRNKSFLGRRKRNEMLKDTEIPSVPLLVEREFQNVEQVSLFHHVYCDLQFNGSSPSTPKKVGISIKI